MNTLVEQEINLLNSFGVNLNLKKVLKIKIIAKKESIITIYKQL